MNSKEKENLRDKINQIESQYFDDPNEEYFKLQEIGHEIISKYESEGLFFWLETQFFSFVSEVEILKTTKHSTESNSISQINYLQKILAEDTWNKVNSSLR